jgi:hypothetical protein
MGSVTVRRLLWLAVAFSVAVGVWFARSLPGARSSAEPAGAGARSATPAAEAGIGHPAIGFRDRSQLAEHYRKHGAEFGDITEAEYLARAQALRDRLVTHEVREAVRRDGVITRFDRRGGEFLAFERDLTIRTFFRPNDGEAYFDRQLKRGRAVP